MSIFRSGLRKWPPSIPLWFPEYCNLLQTSHWDIIPFLINQSILLNFNEFITIWINRHLKLSKRAIRHFSRTKRIKFIKWIRIIPFSLKSYLDRLMINIFLVLYWNVYIDSDVRINVFSIKLLFIEFEKFYKLLLSKCQKICY